MVSSACAPDTITIFLLLPATAAFSPARVVTVVVVPLYPPVVLLIVRADWQAGEDGTRYGG